MFSSNNLTGPYQNRSIILIHQETSVLVVHFAAAFVAFFGTGCYMALETYISFRTSPMSVPKWLAVTRGVVAILFLLSFVISLFWCLLLCNSTHFIVPIRFYHWSHSIRALYRS